MNRQNEAHLQEQLEQSRQLQAQIQNAQINVIIDPVAIADYLPNDASNVSLQQDS